MQLTHSPEQAGDAREDAPPALARFAPAIAVGVSLIALVGLQMTVGAAPAARSPAAQAAQPSPAQPARSVDEAVTPLLDVPALTPAAEAVLPDHDRELLAYVPHGG